MLFDSCRLCVAAAKRGGSASQLARVALTDGSRCQSVHTMALQLRQLASRRMIRRGGGSAPAAAAGPLQRRRSRAAQVGAAALALSAGGACSCATAAAAAETAAVPSCTAWRGRDGTRATLDDVVEAALESDIVLLG